MEVKNGWYYIDGEKFFVKGIGYETHTRPGQAPWIYSFNKNLIELDLDRIKAAGFNTIRTWQALTDEELLTIEKSGVKILMGIWIDPHGSYGNSSFYNSAISNVNGVLNYSSKYNSIIGYIIMNEPISEDIIAGGAENLKILWQAVIDIIHQKSPGIPVSFANTTNGDFISLDQFDFAAYNCYIYNPVTLKNSSGYQGYLKYLKEKRASNKPMIVTEYGLSVSPDFSSSEYSYGGNSEEQQKKGDLYMYRQLIDAGLQGGCVFQYHDGWFKSGNDYVHDLTAEEWFGLIGFNNVNDVYGKPRPAWGAYTEYNKAIITEPKNGEVYHGKIPIEIFPENSVKSFTISINDSVYFSNQITSKYYNSEFTFNTDSDIKDCNLKFNFFNDKDSLVKSETITILNTKAEITLPSLGITLYPEKLNPGSPSIVQMNFQVDSIFSVVDNKIDFTLHPHLGWDPGISKSANIYQNSIGIYAGYFAVPLETKAATFAAGFTVKYGNWTKRITDQKILLNGNWADPIAAKELLTNVIEDKILPNEFRLYQNFPNPFNPITTIKYSVSAQCNVKIIVYDMLGREVKTLVDEQKIAGYYEIKFNGQGLASGVYFYQMKAGNLLYNMKFMLLK